MGVEVVDSKVSHVSAETAAGGNSSVKENGTSNQASSLHEPIKFGSHGEAPVKGEAIKAPEVNFPKDAVDEWPAPKQIHSFYIVKYRSYEDQKLKVKLDQADREIQKINRTRFQLIEKLKAKRADKQQLMALIKPLNAENKQFRMVIDGKRKEIEPLQKNLGQLRSTMGGGREKGVGLYSSEGDLDAALKSLEYRMQHYSNTINEEKKILKEIKQLKATREKVIANAAARAKIEESVGDKESLQEQVKLIGVDLDGVRKEQQAVMTKLKELEGEKALIEREIESLEAELKEVTEKRDKTFESVHKLRKQREDGNASFYENRNLMNKVRDLAAKKDTEALRQLSEAEVERFVSCWAGDRAFKEDYERRLLQSLDMRNLSRDGRMRNPDEKPLMAPNAPTPTETVTGGKNTSKQPKEDSIPPQKDAATSTEEVLGEKNNKVQKKTNNKKKESVLEPSDFGIEEGTNLSLEILQKDSPKVNPVDEAKLKEIKREEEIAKNRQAIERKKKLAEKAAAKAAIKAQKEAEKKLKEREKKAKKKAGVIGAESQESQEPEKVEEEVVEMEETEAKTEKAVPSNGKERKEKVVRHRTRQRGPESLPKAILKRKKAANYWLWAAPAAVMVLLLLVLAYIYLL